MNTTAIHTVDEHELNDAWWGFAQAGKGFLETLIEEKFNARLEYKDLRVKTIVHKTPYYRDGRDMRLIEFAILNYYPIGDSLLWRLLPIRATQILLTMSTESLFGYSNEPNYKGPHRIFAVPLVAQQMEQDILEVVKRYNLSLWLFHNVKVIQKGTGRQESVALGW